MSSPYCRLTLPSPCSWFLTISRVRSERLVKPGILLPSQDFGFSGQPEVVLIPETFSEPRVVQGKSGEDGDPLLQSRTETGRTSNRIQRIDPIFWEGFNPNITCITDSC
jgi:hypothetical protein